jgi:hypothetical protein
MRDAATTAGEVVGLGLAAFALGMMWLPLGVLAAGLALFAVCLAVGRS